MVLFSFIFKSKVQDREVVICVSPADMKLIEIKTRSSRQALWVKKIMSCSNSFRQSQEKHRETWVHGTEFGVCHYTSAPLHTRNGRKSSSVQDWLLSGPIVPSEKAASLPSRWPLSLLGQGSHSGVFTIPFELFNKWFHFTLCNVNFTVTIKLKVVIFSELNDQKNGRNSIESLFHHKMKRPLWPC